MSFYYRRRASTPGRNASANPADSGQLFAQLARLAELGHVLGSGLDGLAANDEDRARSRS
jgi:hypothetical protein